MHHAHGYATAPYHACALTERYALTEAESPSRTVDAPTWPELRRVVAEELAGYRALPGHPG